MAKICPWPWQVSTEDLFKLTGSGWQGLSSSLVDQILYKNGENSLKEKKTHPALLILAGQFSNWLMITLILAAIVSFFLGQSLDSIVILLIVFFSVLLGFFQEYRAEKTVTELQKYISRRSKVCRDGDWKLVESNQLVLGDLVQLRIGDRVPADLRLVQLDELAVNEAILTGEAIPVYKSLGTIKKDSLPIHEQLNIAFSGSFVAEGNGFGVVVATGGDTFLGKTASSILKVDSTTDFQKEMKKFSAFLFKLVVIMSLVVFVVNAVFNHGVYTSLLFALALAVGITPELLPMIVTITLSRGAGLLAKKKVIVKKLTAMESLGKVNILCADKTGTLTEGEFALLDCLDIDKKYSQQTYIQSLVCSSGFTSRGKVCHNDIDQCLWENKKSVLVSDHLDLYQVESENEFDYHRRITSVIARYQDNLWLFAKGAADSILPRCAFVEKENGIEKINQVNRSRLLKQLSSFESAGWRVLVLAKRAVSDSQVGVDGECDLIFCGWLLFEDPLKEDVVSSLSQLKNLGVAIKIISGDAAAVICCMAEKAGIPSKKIISGEQLTNLPDSDFCQKVLEHDLFARVNPEIKQRIVSCLGENGNIVGFLGDGVNDAPALKAADVGIAVDSGAEVAKEAADIILLEKDLSVLAEGIKAGRRTFSNITKYILNTISANYGNMVTVAISSFFLPFIPLLPKQILLNNFISDVPLLAIATDNVDEEFLARPKKWDIALLGLFMRYFGLVSSFFDFIMILPLLVFWRVSPEVFRTAWFIESSLTEMVVTFSIRTKLPFFKSSPSRWLLYLTVFSVALVLLLPFSPAGSYFFDFTNLPVGIWCWIFFVVLGYFFTVEFLKGWFFKRYYE